MLDDKYMNAHFVENRVRTYYVLLENVDIHIALYLRTLVFDKCVPSFCLHWVIIQY